MYVQKTPPSNFFVIFPYAFPSAMVPVSSLKGLEKQQWAIHSFVKIQQSCSSHKATLAARSMIL